MVTALAVLGGSVAVGPTAALASPEASGETVEQALCRLIEGAAAKQNMPVSFLTRLLFQESSFRPNVVSPAGAQGVAQFMPGTAQERGLANPFDPEQAIPASAAFLADLRQQFGNLGLAAAAYNAGAGRVGAWLRGAGGLPFETRDYVQRITGRDASDWQADLMRKDETSPRSATPSVSCREIVASVRLSPGPTPIVTAALAPWGVQLAGNFSKARALATFGRARGTYNAVIGDVSPMIIGTRLRTRGTRAFYRVRVPAPTREAANTLCSRIRSLKGACLVLRS